MVHQLEGRFSQRLGQFLGIRDGRRTADELRLRSIKFANPPESSHYIREMTAIHAAVVMELVDHYVAKILEALRPLGVVRQNAAMQHVRIGQYHVGAFANGPARVLRSVAIVSESADVGAHGVHRGLEFVQLIFGQSFGGKQVHRARAGVIDQTLQYRQVVAKRFATGGGRHYDDILPVVAMPESFGLMCV